MTNVRAMTARLKINTAAVAITIFIRSQPAELTEFDEVLVRRWFKQITVYEDHYTVELKSGLSVDIDAE